MDYGNLYTTASASEISAAVGEREIPTVLVSAVSALAVIQDALDTTGLSEQSYQRLQELQLEMIQNWTLTKTDWHFDLLRLPVVRAVVIMFYVIIIVVGMALGYSLLL